MEELRLFAIHPTNTFQFAFIVSFFPFLGCSRCALPAQCTAQWRSMTASQANFASVDPAESISHLRMLAAAHSRTYQCVILLVHPHHLSLNTCTDVNITHSCVFTSGHAKNTRHNYLSAHIIAVTCIYTACQPSVERVN